jgi:ribonuclease P protein component
MPRLTLRRTQRLAHARQFQAVYAGKVQRSRGVLAVSGAPNGLLYCRLGLSVGRRVGTAVARNRAKRIVREAFRLSQHELPAGEGKGLDLVVSVRGQTGLELAPCREALVDLAASISREWARRQEPS